MSVAGVKFFKEECLIMNRAQARAETADRLNATLIFLFAILIPLERWMLDRSALYFLKKSGMTMIRKYMIPTFFSRP
jgi:hypothetical protein